MTKVVPRPSYEDGTAVSLSNWILLLHYLDAWLEIRPLFEDLLETSPYCMAAVLNRLATEVYRTGIVEA